MNRKVGPVLLAAMAIVALGTAGCRNHMPHGLTWPAGGDIVPSHAKPPEGGYYSNWDKYAVELTVEKPGALRHARSVGITVHRTREGRRPDA